MGLSRIPTTMHHPITGHEIAVGYARNADAVVVQSRPLKVATDVALMAFPTLLSPVASTATQSALDRQDTATASMSGDGNANRPQRDPFHAIALPMSLFSSPLIWLPTAMQNVTEGQDALSIPPVGVPSLSSS